MDFGAGRDWIFWRPKKPVVRPDFWAAREIKIRQGFWLARPRKNPAGLQASSAAKENPAGSCSPRRAKNPAASRPAAKGKGKGQSGARSAPENFEGIVLKIQRKYKGNPAREARRKKFWGISIQNTKQMQKEPGARSAPGIF